MQRWDRAFWVVLVLLVAHGAIDALVFGTLWDLRVFQSSWYDHAWELEIAWRAHLGQWSGREFHYPRGPLWQAIAYAASGFGRATPASTLAGIVLIFRMLSLGSVAWMARFRVQRPALRPVILLALASLSFGAGVPTFRAVLSVLIVLVLVPDGSGGSDELRGPPRWRGAAIAAGLTVAGLLLSFDRFGVAILSVGAVLIAELVMARRLAESMRPALVRFAQFGAALAVGLAALCLLALILGADPIEYVVEQRRLASGYASGMRTPWFVGIPPANVLGLFLAGVTLIVLAVAQNAPRHLVAWLGGALPAALFGVVTSDQGHVFMAILPFLFVLLLAAAESRVPPWTRVGAGLLAGITMLGWFGTHPGAFSIHPAVIRDAWAVASGAKAPDRSFTSDHGRAIAWARTRVAREQPRCIAFWPSQTVAHAMARVPGPTTLALRWNDTQQRALSERIEEADCPLYLYDVQSFDELGGSWFLGPDFLTIVERYRFEERVGAALIGMRRRDAPIEIDSRPLGPVGYDTEIDLPGELSIPLGRVVEGTSIVVVDYTLSIPALRAQLGGLPWAQWRFEHEGEPAGDWQTLHHLRAGEGTVFLSPDTEATEWLWIARERTNRRLGADTLALRFTRRGRFTPSRIGWSVRAMLEHPAPMPALDREASCLPDQDLLETLRSGQAFTRMTSPRPSTLHFHLDPNVHPFPEAEVFFPVRPCEDSCLHASFGVTGDIGDGVDFEVHALWREQRSSLSRVHVPPGREVRVELPLGRWSGPQLLRIGTHNGDDIEGDWANVILPRIGRCSARRWLADAVAAGEATVTSGEVRADGRDLVTGGAGGVVRYPMHGDALTCFGMGYASEGEPVRALVRIVVRAEGLEHVLFEGELTLTSRAVGESHSLEDFAARDVELVVDVQPLDQASTPLRWTGPHIYGCQL